MKKRLFPLLMAIVMVFSILPTFVFAETGDTFTVEAMSGNMPKPVMVSYKVLTEDTGGGTVAVAGQGSNPAIPTDTTFLTLPDTVENNGKTYTVTEIGESAFSNISIECLELPSSLTKIGDNAFNGCSELYWIESPAKIPAQLGEDVFVNCASDLTIQIPTGTNQAYIDSGWPEDSLSESPFLQGTITDTYSKPIEGATVSFYDKNGNFKGSVTTDENGYFDATNCVEYGNEYTAKIEKSGYKAINTKFEVLWGVNGISYIILLAKSDGSFSANTVEGAPITYQILTKDETIKTGTVRVAYDPGPIYSGTLTLPSSVTYDGITYTVTEIGYSAFNAHKKVTQIILPSYLEKIEDAVLFNCQSLNCVISNNHNPLEMIDNAGYTSWGDTTVIIPLGTKQAYIDADFAIDDTDFQEVEFSSLSGKVVDENGNGIANAKVTIFNDSGYQESVYTDSKGGYSFNNYFVNSEFVNSYVENGCNSIRVEKDGYTEYISKIDITEDDITNFNIVMSRIPFNVFGAYNVSNNPQTGDSSQYVIYIAFGCMLMAILAAGCLVVAKKKS